MLVNAQIGYRLLPVTVVRAGLFDSWDGVAVDHSLSLWQRSLRLSPGGSVVELATA